MSKFSLSRLLKFISGTERIFAFTIESTKLGWKIVAQFHGLLRFSSVNPGPVNRSLARFDAQFIGNNKNPGCCSRKTLKRHRGRVSPPFFRDTYIYIHFDVASIMIANIDARTWMIESRERERNTCFAFLAGKRKARRTRTLKFPSSFMRERVVSSWK